MKNFTFLLIILQLVSCVSTKNVAENRNSEYAAHNNFEFFKIWRELDICRFNDNILNVKFALIPEDRTLSEFESDSQLVHIYDSVQVMIEEKMYGFQELKKTYFDTTDQERLKIYQNLKSDSTDNEFLNKIADSPYFELYEDILNRLRSSILKSKFYSSQKEFEAYIQDRSIEVCDKNIYENIFGKTKMSVTNLSPDQFDKLKQEQIGFLIAFSGSYNIDYSDRAQNRIGSETIFLKLFDLSSATLITTADISYFWGSE
jgi:hypothetical protein